jgi:hypothetical protein
VVLVDRILTIPSLLMTTDIANLQLTHEIICMSGLSGMWEYHEFCSFQNAVFTKFILHCRHLCPYYIKNNVTMLQISKVKVTSTCKEETEL